VADDGVLIDCNHPLAGAPLSFTLRVLALERGAGRSGLAAAVE
jgi:FKBP-type peptidyl-prolyl cis-trans isomerase 2